jgi:hypothetical protein
MRINQIIVFKRLIAFVFIGLLFSHCSNEETISFSRISKKCKKCAVFQSEITVKRKSGDYKFDCSDFMNSVLVPELGLENKFQNDDFDYLPLKLDTKHQIIEARAVFKNYTYYLYFNDNLGVIYVSRFHPTETNEYKLKKHPLVDHSELLQIINKCIYQNQSVLYRLYGID